MPLTSSEFNILQQMVTENPRMSAKKLLSTLKENVIDNQVEKAYERATAENSVHVIDSEPSETLTATRKKEKDRGFKIRTEGESLSADASRGTK